MAFGTPTDEPYDVTITDEVDADSLLPEAIFAVRVPFFLTDDEACISDNFVSSQFSVPAGITHVCFLVMPNCRVFFILELALAALTAPAVAGTESVLTYNIKGQVSQVALPQGQTHQYGYDQAGRVVTHVMPSPLSAGTGASVGYARDSRGVLTGLTDPRGLVTGYSVNGLGDVEGLSSPDTGTATYVANETGQLVSRTNAKGSATFEYDAVGRPTRIDYGDETVELTYDTAPNGAGQVATMTDSSGSTSWAYDNKGNVASRTQTTSGHGGGAGAALTFQQVVSAGRVVQQTYPSGRVVVFTYDGNNVASISVDGVPVISNVKYQPFGGVASWQMGATGTYSRTFNTKGQMTGYTFEAGQRTLVWDESNRITSIANPDGTKWTYGYDNLDRVVSTVEGIQGSRSYTMDATGNRSSVTLNGALYSAAIETASNRLSSSTAPGSTANYSYDGVGQVLGDGARTYTWNNAGYLVQATGPSGAATYRYNGVGQRVTKVINNGNARHYLYADDGVSLLGEYAQVTAGASANPLYEIVYLDGTPVLALSAGRAYYIQVDHLNAPRLVKDGMGAVVWRWAADAYGIGAADQNPSGVGAFELNLRFPGQQFDAESGLYYNNARYYDSNTGRYISSDPVGIAAGVNTFAYALNSPGVNIDPTGLDVWLEGAATDEPSIHQSISVGNPRGVYRSYSFGLSPTWPGIVYSDIKPGGEIQRYKKTTVAQDLEVEAYLERAIGVRGIYGVTDICRSWSQDQFARAPGVEGPRPFKYATHILQKKLGDRPFWGYGSDIFSVSSSTGTSTSR